MLFVIQALAVSLGFLLSPQAEPACTRSTDCRQLALDAAARQDFETFHSLAWRAVQTGAPNDADLMFLLARAQSLSGRPDDALVMLARLADRGVPHPEVETLDDFSRVREMPGWPGLLEKMNGGAASSLPPTPVAVTPPAPPVTNAAPSPKPPAALRSTPVGRRPAALAAPAVPRPSSSGDAASPALVASESIIPVPQTVGAAIAMAYDRVSSRMIMADDSTGTLKVVSEVSGNAVDLHSAGWGGGYRTNALVIDSKRGDLWVVGTRADPPDSIVHRMQLISGRLLYSVARPEDAGETRFASVALSTTSVFVLDAEGGRIFELDAAAKTLRSRAALPERELTSLTVASDTVAYVAHGGGILRVDLSTKRSETVEGPSGIALDGIQWVGHFENSLLAVQRQPDGVMAAMRFRLDRRGRAVTAVETYGAAAAKGAAILDDTFFFVAASPDGAAVARVRLRSVAQASRAPAPGKRP